MKFEYPPQSASTGMEQDSAANAAGSDAQMLAAPVVRLRSGMPLEEVAQIDFLPHRALALYSSGASRDDPRMITLAETVNVPDAGDWGQLVQTLLVPPVPKPKRARAKKEQRPREGEPNLWLDFAELSAEVTSAPASRTPPAPAATESADADMMDIAGKNPVHLAAAF